MATIGIVGLGNIGLRHIEGLFNLPLDCNCSLYLCDSSEEAVQKASTFVESLGFERSSRINFCRSLDELPKRIDLVIVATTSRGRASVVEKLVKGMGVKKLILEKVLFDNIRDYERIGELLKREDTQAWVNCPRRLWADYQSLKEKLFCEPLSYIGITGGCWGMACNTIHFLDLIAYIGSKNTDITIDDAQFSKEPIHSKRPGFEEVIGRLHGHVGSCQFSIEDVGVPMQLTIRIATARHQFFINEAEGFCITWKSGEKEASQHPFSVPYQSEISYIPVRDILSTNDCHLTQYDESAYLHEIFMSALAGHFESLGYDHGSFPIT